MFLFVLDDLLTQRSSSNPQVVAVLAVGVAIAPHPWAAGSDRSGAGTGEESRSVAGAVFFFGIAARGGNEFREVAMKNWVKVVEGQQFELA